MPPLVPLRGSTDRARAGNTQNQPTRTVRPGYLRTSASGIWTPGVLRGRAPHNAEHEPDARAAGVGDAGNIVNTILAALAIAHENFAALEIDILDPQLTHSIQAHPCAVNNGPMSACVLRSAESRRSHLAMPKHDRQSLRLPGPLQFVSQAF